MNHFLLVATDLEKALEAKDKLEIEFEKVRNQIVDVENEVYDLQTQQEEKHKEMLKVNE